MCKATDEVRLPGTAARQHVSANLIRFSGLLLLALLLGLSLARAEDPDERYLQILDGIKQADALGASGKVAEAKTKYQQAEAALKTFQAHNPYWNPKLVSLRLDYVAQKIAALAEPPPPAAAEPKAAESASGTQVKLLEPGAEPRTVLRLHPKPGDQQTVNLTMKMAMETKMGAMQDQKVKMPAITMAMDVTVKDISDSGDITYGLVMGDTQVADEPGSPSPVAEMIKGALGGAKGMTGTGTVSSRGFAKKLDFNVPAGAEAQTRQIMGQMKDSFSAGAVPLPEEAVGPGARWEVKMPIKSQGMKIDQTMTCELVSAEGDHLTIKRTITQHAANQKIQNPAMPGMKIDLTKMTGKATGESTFDLAKLMASAESTQFHSETSMAINMGGQKQAVSSKLDMSMQLEAK